jgi:hypothetical protein
MYNLTNITIQVPDGATQHGNPRILCVHGPAWKDYLMVTTFFATNYIAHAATVKTTPGDGLFLTIYNIILALFFPMSGLLRALNAIARMARFGGSELKKLMAFDSDAVCPYSSLLKQASQYLFCTFHYYCVPRLEKQ